MPLYEFECPCGKRADEFLPVANRNDAPMCCGKPMQRVIGGYSVVPDLQPYYDENLESYVKSKQHRQQLMTERGVSEKFGTNWLTAASSKRRR